ncbi:MAG: hypothetical protein ACR2MS_08095 [Weeksellaceae bacterium]
MKNLPLLMLMLILALTSCTTTKVERQAANDFRGDWTLNQIVSDEGQSVVITKLFGDAPLECFEGSTWHLVANNNSGTYTLSGAGCDTAEKPIKWYVEEDGNLTYFWFKQLQESMKAKDVLSGYKMQLVTVDESQAHLMQEVPFEGGKMNIHYYFTKQ